jgi:2-keto-4-pentenoate hydratase
LLPNVPHFDETPYVRREMTPLAAVQLTQAELPSTPEAAYALVREAIADDSAYGAAWKLGGTTATTQRIFSVDKLYFGVLHQSELAVRPNIAPGFPTHELKGEAEIALRLAPTVDALLDAGSDAIRMAQPSSLFDGWCIALEMPSSPISNLVEMGVVALIADRCAAGFLALGEIYTLEEMSSWDSAEIRIAKNGLQLTSGGAGALLAPPHECARAFLIEALEQNHRPCAGQWVSTGGATSCVSFEPGARIDVFYGQSLELSFTAGT